ncbi:MAG: glycogen/starch/alpha-glucan phosphorylase [Fusobacteriaceae bacterium]
MILNKKQIKEGIVEHLLMDSGKKVATAEKHEIYSALAKTVLMSISENWVETTEKYQEGRQVHYLSSEFLMGRALGNNLINLGMMTGVKGALEDLGIDYNIVEGAEEDAGIGNGGLGRLAACFMDSLATLNLPGRGYSIRYKNGIFNQKIENGYQVEYPETWLKYGDPWSVRKMGEEVLVKFKDMTVRAIPYDTPVIGYGTKNVNTLRLWEAEPLNDLDYAAFSAQNYDKALWEANRAQDISRVLYPNDSTNEGKKLRLRQQYFFVSASLQDILRKFKTIHGNKFSLLPGFNVIQLNDTHPTIAIPELMRLLCDVEGVEWTKAWDIVVKTFAYTNHTILSEALEKWWVGLYEEILPRIYEIIKGINNQFNHLLQEKFPENIEKQKKMAIIQGDLIHMAWLAIYGSSYTNGVAAIHTEILKNEELKDWYELYPKRFQNKTNGITQRRWLLLSNPELSDLITNLIGKSWIKDLSQLKKLEKYAEDTTILEKFLEIKQLKKQELVDYLKMNQGAEINVNSIFDVQVKRLHEYKRQLLNIFHVIDLYNKIKSNPGLVMEPVTYIFGSKAAPGYRRAKGIIKLINEVAKKIDNDPEVRGRIKVIFVENYRVSVAHKIFPAADISEQISTAGKEASGTGNMKFMLNGALTLGTLDGANVEIIEEAGLKNNYIFGLTVDDIHKLKFEGYNPWEYYNSVPGLKVIIDSLINGTFSDDGTGMFKEIYDAIMNGSSWHEADEYYLLKDFEAYREIQKKANEGYSNKMEWAKKAWLNITNAGKFSSDRTISQYAEELWHIEAKEL